MLNLDNFQKSYHSQMVLNIEHLTIKPGIYWIKGSNGSGKSTLLKSIAGFFSFKGEISWNNSNLKRDGVAYRRLVSFADAEPVFPEFLTGNEMIALFARTKGAAAGQQTQYISDMNMQHFINNPLGTYSSGMLKKLSLVLAFLGTPELILLDEPLNALDAASLEILYRWINHKSRHANTTFLLSSHQPVDRHMLLAYLH